MKSKSIVALAAALILLLLLSAGGLAMSSPGFHLDWFVQPSGGGHASSASYAVDATTGQVAASLSVSPNYKAGLGFWYGILSQPRTYVPAVAK
jgi:hypothetical protein